MTKPDSQTKQPAGKVIPLLLIMILALAGFWWFSQPTEEPQIQQGEETPDDAVPAPLTPLERVQQRMSCVGCDLQRADLQNADLSRLDLSEANLSQSQLGGANLQSTNLRGAKLNEADLRQANLESANLRDANLRWSNLQQANLKNANVGNADFRGADLSGAVGVKGTTCTTETDQTCLE